MAQKPKVFAKNYGYEAIESYNKYVPNSDSTQEDIHEIWLQYLRAGFEIDKIQSYWAWLHYCESIKQPWLPVTSTYDVPFLLRPFIEIKMPQPKTAQTVATVTEQLPAK